MFCDAVVRDASRRARPAAPAGAPAPAGDADALMVHSFDRRSLLQELRAHGVRLTPQRRALVEAIQSASEHLDVDALLAAARARGVAVDRATVYRTLELLKRLRLVEELDLMHLQGEKHFYEARTRRDHIHLACFACGRILEFATPRLERLKLELARATGFEIRVTRLETGGYCRDCREKKARAG